MLDTVMWSCTIVLGSLLFVLFDSLLAFRMIKNVPERGVMVTYPLAQLLLRNPAKYSDLCGFTAARPHI